ncbi:MAG: site-specific integrase [Acidobacteriaceae bacterium]
MNRPQYQFGTLYSEPRKKGPHVWVYRWREANPQGKRQLRKQIIGTMRELRTRADAQRAVEAFRHNINRHAVEHGGPPQTVHKLVEHYRLKELPMQTHEGKTRGTKLVYNSNLKLYIVPRWGDYPLRRVSSVEVEDWLKTLKLAPSSRAKIRNLMSTVFRHAIRWGWLSQNENPIAMVRVSSKRQRVPVTLTAEEFRTLFAVLPDRERTMGTICATTGLRICEVLGLKWEDIDFLQKTANVLRSFVDGSIGPCKTEVSQQPVPLDEIVLEELVCWRSTCLYSQAEDWVFGSERLFGRMPVWPDSLRSKILQPAARKAGITKQIGWHTFRHTYSSLLAETGNDVKVLQELMRHAKVSTTMDLYTHARMENKRIAQRKAVDVLFNRNPQPEAAL